MQDEVYQVVLEGIEEKRRGVGSMKSQKEEKNAHR